MHRHVGARLEKRKVGGSAGARRRSVLGNRRRRYGGQQPSPPYFRRRFASFHRQRAPAGPWNSGFQADTPRIEGSLQATRVLDLRYFLMPDATGAFRRRCFTLAAAPSPCGSSPESQPLSSSACSAGSSAASLFGCGSDADFLQALTVPSLTVKLLHLSQVSGV